MPPQPGFPQPNPHPYHQPQFNAPPFRRDDEMDSDTGDHYSLHSSSTTRLAGPGPYYDQASSMSFSRLFRQTAHSPSRGLRVPATILQSVSGLARKSALHFALCRPRVGLDRTLSSMVCRSSNTHVVRGNRGHLSGPHPKVWLPARLDAQHGPYLLVVRSAD